MIRTVSPTTVLALKGCSIIENILVAFELIHRMKTKYNGKFGDVALKIDIFKAYDKVD